MGLLAPLYALAALAIAGPIVFHLIRRQPQGQKQFSSLMFLSPSPPRLTRRSRLDHLLLLLLRALAIGLIAFAFARPYFRQESFLNAGLSGRHIVVLLDTSASMQRQDVWRAAQAELEQLLDSLSPQDHVALYTVDETSRVIVGLEGGRLADAAAAQQAVRTAAQNLEPSWRRTELAEGLKAAADLLQAATISGKIGASDESEVVLISDLHTESGLKALQGFPWPDTIRLDVRRILPAVPGNARPSLMLAEEAASANVEYRVRIENNLDSREQAFELAWADAQGPRPTTSTRVQVPSGQVRVVPMTSRPEGTDRISLLGDAWADDNHAYVVQSAPLVQKIAFLGTPQTRRVEDLGFFLQKAPLSTPFVQRQVIPLASAKDVPVTLADPAYESIVLEPSAAWLPYTDRLRAFAEDGGTVLICLARTGVDAELQSDLVETLFNLQDVSISEAKTRDFALMGSLQYRHPVFAPFADPRFNDFSKIRIWSHRQVDLPESDELSIVARFDDEAPMLVQQPVGDGSLWLLTTGWQPSGSGLGLSSKFVPILSGILDPEGRTSSSQWSAFVGERIPTGVFEQAPKILHDGDDLEARQWELGGDYVRIFRPGLYTLQTDALKRQVAIQIPPSESQLAPLDADVFEQYGIQLGQVVSDRKRRETARQLQVEELEQKQRTWQWLIAIGIVVLAVETGLAGWLARTGDRPRSAVTKATI